MPDALSKTIPLWCCVLNRALFPENPEYHSLYTPPATISPSEHAQMLSRIPEGLADFRRLNPDLPSLRGQLSKPLRPTWVTHDTELDDLGSDTESGVQEENTAIFTNFHPVVCCTASRRIVDGEMSGHTGYIQGAGDDTENWAHGLTPPVFWAHSDELLSTPESNLPDTIQSLVAKTAEGAQQTIPGTMNDNTVQHLPPTVRQLTPHLCVSPLPFPSLPEEASWCTIALSSTPSPPESWTKSPTRMEVGIGKHKVASRNLRTALPVICHFVAQYLHSGPPSAPGKRVLIACETGGRDLAVGVALALLCWCFEDEGGAVVRTQVAQGDKGNVPGTQQSLSFNKTMIKVRLGRIMMAMPDANPNRATLQSINSFLMDWK